jgi:hypothetical protein
MKGTVFLRVSRYVVFWGVALVLTNVSLRGDDQSGIQMRHRCRN